MRGEDLRRSITNCENGENSKFLFKTLFLVISFERNEK